MALNFGHDIDLRGNKIIGHTIETLSSAPSTPNTGQIYYNSTTKEPYYFDGTDWRQYGENVALSWKDSARAYQDSNLAGSFNSSLNTLTLSGNGALLIDGVALVDDDRVVLAGQSSASQNGVYSVQQGDGSNPAVLTRTSDADSASDLKGLAVVIREGSTYADSAFIQTSDNITLNSTSISFDRFTLNLEYATATEAEAKSNTTKVVTPSALTNFARSKRVDFTGNGSSTGFSVTHGLGQYAMIQVINLQTFQQEIVEIDGYSAAGGGSCIIRFGIAPTNGHQYRVLIVEIG